MKNKNPIFAIALGTLVVAFVGCSDLKTDLPSPVTPGVKCIGLIGLIPLPQIFTAR